MRLCSVFVFLWVLSSCQSHDGSPGQGGESVPTARVDTISAAPSDSPLTNSTLSSQQGADSAPSVGDGLAPQNNVWRSGGRGDKGVSEKNLPTSTQPAPPVQAESKQDQSSQDKPVTPQEDPRLKSEKKQPHDGEPSREDTRFTDGLGGPPTRKITLERLKEMAYLYIRINSQNMKSIKEIYDSGFVDGVIYERAKVSAEKNLRIIRLLNRMAVEKVPTDKAFIRVYTGEFVTIVKDGLVASQEVLQYLQKNYDDSTVSQKEYIASANNLKANVAMVWDIVHEIDR